MSAPKYALKQTGKVGGQRANIVRVNDTGTPSYGVQIAGEGDEIHIEESDFTPDTVKAKAPARKDGSTVRDVTLSDPEPSDGGSGPAVEPDPSAAEPNSGVPAAE